MNMFRDILVYFAALLQGFATKPEISKTIRNMPPLLQRWLHDCKKKGRDPFSAYVEITGDELHMLATMSHTSWLEGEGSDTYYLLPPRTDLEKFMGALIFIIQGKGDWRGIFSNTQLGSPEVGNLIFSVIGDAEDPDDEVRFYARVWNPAFPRLRNAQM